MNSTTPIGETTLPQEVSESNETGEITGQGAVGDTKAPTLSVLGDVSILRILCNEARATQEQVVATVGLLEDDNTVPFIARYRKEVTGNLDEVQIRTIDEKRRYYSDLLARRQTIIHNIESQGHLTPELRTALENCLDRTRLEDLYLPYRPKRRTRALVAVEKGLEPFARLLYEQRPGETTASVHAKADTYISEERGLTTRDEVYAGAQDIVAEWIAEDAELRQILRDLMFSEGEVRSRLRAPRNNSEAPSESVSETVHPQPTIEITSGEEATPAAPPAPLDERARSRQARAAQKAKEREEALARYRIYHDFHESVRTIPSHRILAIRRAAREEILSYSIEVDGEKALALLRPHVVMDLASPYASYVEAALQDGYNRLMKPSIESEVKQALRKQADTEAIRVFTENLENLLMTPPAGSLVVMGIDPGFRTGCKVAVVDTTGHLLDHATIYPTEPRNDEKGAEKVLNNLIDRHGVGAIAIGNGTASRETHSFVRRMLGRRATPGVFCMVVNESGASVYSASDIAREEFPDLDVTVRGAISIARRLQDPLAELVKIDPRSLGVGQYQHDIDQKRLRQALYDTVESCVNRVGVDLNTASAALLRYVAGINEKVAEAIVERRKNDGVYRTRQDIMQVSGVGPKTFEQAAGFLRIRDGAMPLDNTAVHPESYSLVEKLASFLGSDIERLIHSPEKLGSLDRTRFLQESGPVGKFTLDDILEELARPGRDPREKFVVPEFRDDVQSLDDLKPGMELEGTVTNVANFGAFVDVGVHQDGLVHVSELSHRFVQDPREIVRVGDIVKVRVLSVDHERKRIALSMKALTAPPAGQQPRPPVERRPQHDTPRPSREWTPRPAGERPQREHTPRGPRPAVAVNQNTTVVSEEGSNYVPGAWKGSATSTAPTPTRSRKPKATSAPKPEAATASTQQSSEVSDRIKALQERFNRNR
jgi:uncharacterized protein